MLKIPKVNKNFIPPAWASEAQLKKYIFLYAVKFYFHQRQLAVARVLAVRCRLRHMRTFSLGRRRERERRGELTSWLVLEIVVHNHTPLPMADGCRVVYGLMTKVDRM
jgi:hypothetical protein